MVINPILRALDAAAPAANADTLYLATVADPDGDTLTVTAEVLGGKTVITLDVSNPLIVPVGDWRRFRAEVDAVLDAAGRAGGGGGTLT